MLSEIYSWMRHPSQEVGVDDGGPNPTGSRSCPECINIRDNHVYMCAVVLYCCCMVSYVSYCIILEGHCVAGSNNNNYHNKILQTGFLGVY